MLSIVRAMIDLRSDTVTQPSPAMRKVMAEAPVGDDVYGEDPTVQSLERGVAERLGTEAALFVTSGTMGNQLAIACHTERGDEVLVGEDAHPIHYECAAAAALSGVQLTTVGTGGLFTAAELIAHIRPSAYYAPRPRLVCVENTHNRAGGRVFPQGNVVALLLAAHDRGLATHLDGARLWNASVATGDSLLDLARGFDSITVCFSKGLGAPVGSALAGPRAFIERARRMRKMWGGGMRQSGILAAAALYAMENNVARLAEDHEAAHSFAERIGASVHVRIAPVETNIVSFETTRGADAERVALECKEQRVLLSVVSPSRLRAVMHLDVPRAEIPRAADVVLRAIERART